MTSRRRARLFRTIQSRIVALSIGVVVVTFGISTAVAYTVFSTAIWERHDAELRETVDTIARAFRTGIVVAEGNEYEAAHHLLNELHFPNRRVGLFTADGEPFAARTGPDDHPEHLHGPPVEIGRDDLLALARSANLGQGGRYALATRHGGIAPDGATSRLVVAPFRSPTSGTRFLVAVEESNAATETSLALLRDAMLASAPLLFLLAAVGGWLIARRSLAPVGAMSRRAERIGAANLGERLPVASEDELGRLARVFNDLLDRLEREFDRIRQFTADASHELRTPLAAVRGEAQVALKREREAAEYRESLEVIVEETSHMARIVEDLFTLARADAGAQPEAAEPFYLDDLVEEVCRATRALAVVKSIALEADTTGDVEVRGDEPLIRRAITNLVGNAIRYTHEGGRVRVTLDYEDGRARVEVSDTGIGIAPEERERIFERFQRVDDARSRSEGGAGLGLAIVRLAVESHGGRLSVSSELGRGSTFTFELPASRVQSRASGPASEAVGREHLAR
jgi:heavy metal sensor kinase